MDTPPRPDAGDDVPDPITVAEMAYAAMTGNERRGVGCFAMVMAFIWGTALGLFLGMLLAYVVVTWAANYDNPPLPPWPIPTEQQHRWV